jgi:pyruvate dehydrogenase E2 component (dihydrolipoamide acetyltransferase)
VGYEVQDDGYLAKILVPEGTMEVKVGQQVAIIVDS